MNPQSSYDDSKKRGKEPVAADDSGSGHASSEAPAPSRVIHLRNVGPDITQHDLILLASQFGPVEQVLLLRSKNQALMQFADIQASMNFVQYYTTVTTPSIRGRNVYPQFSSHPELNNTSTSSSSSGPSRPSDASGAGPAPAAGAGAGAGGLIDSPPSRILLVTILNVLYPITVDVLHQVFGPHGSVEKIVIFQKKGLQALIQYHNVQQATLAKELLNGQNIYTNGSCQLQIQFSTLQTELNVSQNSDKTRDFTNPSLPRASGDHALRFAHHDPYAGAYPAGLMPGAAGIGVGMGGAMAGQNSVLLVSNLNEERANCPALFNLFSNYGNVLRIKILHNKPDHALVQMSDYIQASTALHYLKGLVLFGKQMDINYSKHSYISATTQDPADPHCQDYSSSAYNRFHKRHAQPGGKMHDTYKHMCAPGTLLHVSNLSPTADQASVEGLFAPYGPLTGIKVFDINGKKQALIQFSTNQSAAEALVTLHNAEFDGRSIKLSFSKNKL
eukprot:TRINITY_DN1767_c0_g1_i1.p1 TRINITY_DN1767_c0_g1~~TRINITY_DN1767_c0_g1_i1.p1  ORF type:complete len:547 (+),score=171.99 TRINITY_DN1767_c0_g1_i1:136-1641(+)